MDMRRTLYALVMSAALVAGAHAWVVTIINSQGQLNPGAVTTNVPAVVLNNPLPQVTFLTAAGNPNPILVGDGTSFTNGTFSATYSIAPSPGDRQSDGLQLCHRGVPTGQRANSVAEEGRAQLGQRDPVRRRGHDNQLRLLCVLL
jgi:hypothetical protein